MGYYIVILFIKYWVITHNYTITHKLTIHAKTDFIVFRSPMLKHDSSDPSVNVGGNLIKPSEKVCDLGVILNQTLSFDDHISAICQPAHFHIRNIVSIRNLLSFDACVTLIHALIGSRLDCCSTTLQMQKLKDCNKFKIKQRAFSQGRLAKTTLLL